jgi:DNA polymerase-3 subunit delta
MPQASAAALIGRLEKGHPPAAILLLGEDSFWRDLCRRKLEDALVPPESRDWALTKLSAEESDAEEIIGRAQTLPMLAPRQLIFVATAEAWEKGGDDRMKATLAALASYLENPAPFTVLVLEAEKLDQRTRLAKLLTQHTLVVDLDAPGVAPAQLAIQLGRERGVEFEPGAAEALAEATAGRAARLAAEVEKLACYAGEARRITPADVRELVVAEISVDVWVLADLFAAGNRGKALETVDELLEKGESAPALVGALAWMFRKLLKASELPAGTNEWQAARHLGMRPDSARTAIEHARRLTRGQLAGAFAALADADDRLKSGADDRNIMEFLVARLSGKSARGSVPAKTKGT